MSAKAGSFAWLAGPRPLLDWSRRQQAVAACRARHSLSCWIGLGRAWGADYAVIGPEWRPRPLALDLTLVWQDARWAVWRYPHIP